MARMSGRSLDCSSEVIEKSPEQLEKEKLEETERERAEKKRREHSEAEEHRRLMLKLAEAHQRLTQRLRRSLDLPHGDMGREFSEVSETSSSASSTPATPALPAAPVAQTPTPIPPPDKETNREGTRLLELLAETGDEWLLDQVGSNSSCSMPNMPSADDIAGRYWQIERDAADLEMDELDLLLATRSPVPRSK